MVTRRERTHNCHRSDGGTPLAPGFEKPLAQARDERQHRVTPGQHHLRHLDRQPLDQPELPVDDGDRGIADVLRRIGRNLVLVPGGLVPGASIRGDP